ncbi:hypothetical protein Tco_0932296 [Tanacetum coccineum]
MKKFDFIPQRLEEDYHSIKDDIPLVSVYATRNVIVRGLLISNEFHTDDIRATPEYKEYEKVDDRERDEIAEATLLSLTKHKTVIVAEAQENVAKVQENLMEEDFEKMVNGEDEESYASKLVDSIFLNKEEDFGTRIEPESHKENPKIVDDDDDEEEKKDDKKDDDNDDDDNDDHTDHSLINTQELMAIVSPIPAITSQDHSKPTSSKTKILPGSIAGISRRRGKIRKHIKTTFVTNKYFLEKMREILDLLKNLILELTVAKTNELIKEAILRLVNVAITRDREIAPTNVPNLFSQEFTTHAPSIIEELFKSHMQNIVLNMYPTTSSSTAMTSTTDLQHQLYLKMKTNL